MLFIGHRGSHSSGEGSGLPRENTLPAFEQAIRDGADMVELDVWQTDAGELVVYHDETLPGQSTPLSSLTAAQVSAHILPGGASLPRLAEVLELCRGRVPVNIELKHGRALERTVRLVRQLRVDDEIVLSSFELAALYAAADLAPSLRRAVIMGTSSLALNVRLREAFPFWVLERAQAQALHANDRLISRALVDALHGLGVDGNVWTVNEAGLARRLEHMGVDGVFCDRPAELRASVAGRPR